MGVAREPYPESGIAYARQGDTADKICARYLGQWSGVTEQVLDLNPTLADLGIVLPEGTRVQLPAPTTAKPTTDTRTKLWD